MYVWSVPSTWQTGMMLVEKAGQHKAYVIHRVYSIYRTQAQETNGKKGDSSYLYALALVINQARLSIYFADIYLVLSCLVCLSVCLLCILLCIHPSVITICKFRGSE